MPHTPGPWKISDSNNNHESFVIASDNKTICWISDSFDEELNIYYTSLEDIANAKLIALVPEMLQSLIALTGLLTVVMDADPQWDFPDPRKKLNAAKKIIKKITS
jgi:hypothetical protein